MTPIRAAAAVMIHADHVLLVRRRNPPDAGLWGYPAGHVEAGESDARAATCELPEETDVTARAIKTLTVLHVGDRRRPFHLAMVLCRYVCGTPRAADDARAAEWVVLDDVRSPDRHYSEGVCDVLALALRA